MKKLPIQQDPFLQRLTHPLLDEKRISVWIQRLDIIHEELSGNKWYKLSGNLDTILKNHSDPTIITFGGAFSNHLYSTAAACSLLSVPSVGIVRGEIPKPLNSTLQYCESRGMKLIPVSRAAYRDKQALQAEFSDKYKNAVFIPEGGTNSSAVKACAGIPDNKMRSMDYVCLPVGTGGTMAGVIGGLNPGQQVLGFSVLKGDFLSREVKELVNQTWKEKEFPSWEINTNYHLGGYARIRPELTGFIQGFYRRHGILLDPVYTGKMMYGLMDMIRLGCFEEDTSICAIHTGGLQGWNGIRERFNIDPSTF